MIPAAAAVEGNNPTVVKPRDYRVGDIIDRRYAVVEALGRDGLDAVYLVLDTIGQRRTQLWLGPDGRYHVRGQRRRVSKRPEASDVTVADASLQQPRSTVPLAARATIIDPALARPRASATPDDALPITAVASAPADEIEALDDSDLLELTDDDPTVEQPILLTRTRAAETTPTTPSPSPPKPRKRSYTPFVGDPFARPLSADEALAMLPHTTPTRRPQTGPAPRCAGAAAVIVAPQTGADALLGDARQRDQRATPRRRPFVIGVAVGLLVGAVPALIALLM